MSGHTPEPWLYDGGPGYKCVRRDGSVEATRNVYIALMDRKEPETAPVERDENAKRIVACVNACEGWLDPQRIRLSQEFLEAVDEVLHQGVRERRQFALERLRNARDALREG